MNQSHRRGFAVAVILVVVAVLGLAVVGSIGPLGQEAEMAALRVETLRAFYAAESGMVVTIGTLNAGIEVPGSGDSVVIGHQTIRFVTVPEGVGEIVIEGASGWALRRVLLEVE